MTPDPIASREDILFATSNDPSSANASHALPQGNSRDALAALFSMLIEPEVEYRRAERAELLASARQDQSA